MTPFKTGGLAMGEHKLREAGNGDEPRKVSSHIVRILDRNVDVMPIEQQEQEIIDGYQSIAQQAKDEDSFILSVVESGLMYTKIDPANGTAEYRERVRLTAQRISREDFERNQRLAQMGRR